MALFASLSEAEEVIDGLVNSFNKIMNKMSEDEARKILSEQLENKNKKLFSLMTTIGCFSNVLNEDALKLLLDALEKNDDVLEARHLLQTRMIVKQNHQNNGSPTNQSHRSKIRLKRKTCVKSEQQTDEELRHSTQHKRRSNCSTPPLTAEIIKKEIKQEIDQNVKEEDFSGYCDQEIDSSTENQRRVSPVVDVIKQNIKEELIANDVNQQDSQNSVIDVDENSSSDPITEMTDAEYDDSMGFKVFIPKGIRKYKYWPKRISCKGCSKEFPANKRVPSPAYNRHCVRYCPQYKKLG